MNARFQPRRNSPAIMDHPLGASTDKTYDPWFSPTWKARARAYTWLVYRTAARSSYDRTVVLAHEEQSEGRRKEGSTQKPTYILSMRFYRQEYIKRHDLFHGRTGPIRDRAKTHKQARYTLIIQWKFRQDLRNIHGKLARFMAWPVLPVYARRLRASHILSDKRYETSVEAATATRKHLHTNESRCFFAPLRKRHTPRISTVAQISSDPSPSPRLSVSPRIFPSDLVQPDLFGWRGVNFGLVSLLRWQTLFVALVCPSFRIRATV